MKLRLDVLVIGSGAGGATTAFEIASRGREVMVIEEGFRHAPDTYGQRSSDALRQLYRRRGMTPILGTVPLGYVEGRCVGGSTEINSGFWHRTLASTLADWRDRFGLVDASINDLQPHFELLETLLSVSCYHEPWPSMTSVFAEGARLMRLTAAEVPRVVHRCGCPTPCSSGCRTGGKQSMSRSLVPMAEAAGAKILTQCRITRLIARKNRIVEAVGFISHNDERGDEAVRLFPEQVIVCCGPTETPSLLLRSGVTESVGKTLLVHPMLKVAARFPYETQAATQPIPLLQINLENGVSIGGAHFSLGHLAMHLSENWPALAGRIVDANRMALFHVSVKGTGLGSIAPALIGTGTRLRYNLSDWDHERLCEATKVLIALLLRSGADEVYPAINGLPVIRHESEISRLSPSTVAKRALSLTTVHAFSSCPIGEHRRHTAADSFGKVWGFENLYVNDASMLPSSPGVNPQGSVMALARRNVHHFLASQR